MKDKLMQLIGQTTGTVIEVGTITFGLIGKLSYKGDEQWVIESNIVPDYVTFKTTDVKSVDVETGRIIFNTNKE